MLFFPHCKINLGLYVTEKREDGYHNIETIFYPIAWSDALEVLENPDKNAPAVQLHSHFVPTDLPMEQNLVYKAYNLLKQTYDLPALQFYLLKNIPSGAGLGGGSSDAAHCLLLLNQKFGLGLNPEQLESMAAQLGSDCPYFIRGGARYASGKGEILSDCRLDLSAYHILLVNPGLHSNTAAAYGKIRPLKGRSHLKGIVENTSPEAWKGLLTNDFEPVVGKEFPLIPQLVEALYNEGAAYAAMSGSGSTVFGIFKNRPDQRAFKGFRSFLQEAKKPVS